ncbi:MAG TPA: TetR/AcrR family transcriptional regulator [Caulobacteraceae bacterium]|nr:TetR/AcrR family transcriptional regulator [Caulobacteraceae bacterium]
MTEPSTAARGRRGADRTRDVARTALACFCAGGYRLTQIAQVSERMGVSVGSIYRYVQSKDALFHLAVLEALGELPDRLALPLSVSGLGETAERIRAAGRSDRLWSRLEDAVAAPAPADVRAEARAIAGQLYDSISRRAPIVRLLDRCAHETPELAEIFDQEVREKLMRGLVAWVARRGLAGAAGRAEAEALARGAMEAIAWLAKTRLGDPTALSIGEDSARAAAVRIFEGAFTYAPARKRPVGSGSAAR